MSKIEISNSEDIMDSRDIIERIEELDGDDKRDQDDNEELAALKALAEEGADYAEDWEFGSTLIRDSYFTEYAEDFANDIGAVDSEAKWPNTHINWDAAAHELQYDYSSIEFDGVIYWVR